MLALVTSLGGSRRSTPTSRCSSPSFPTRRSSRGTTTPSIGRPSTPSCCARRGTTTPTSNTFLDWARSVAAVTALWNATAAHRVERRQAIPPRRWRRAVSRSCRRSSWPPATTSRRVAGDIVVKPAVGAGSVDVRRFGDDPAGAHDHIDAVHARGAVAMVQHYQSAIDEHGETGMVFVGGAFSHAFRKEPILASAVEWEAVEGASAMFARERVTATEPVSGRAASSANWWSRRCRRRPTRGRSAADRRRSGVARARGRSSRRCSCTSTPAAPARAAAVFRNLMP